MNDNSIELSSISNTSIESLIIGEEILDFGYLEEFNRNKEFMLIQKGVVKRKKEIRDLYEVMNEC